MLMLFPVELLALGGVAVALGAILGGLTGFGYGLIATPLLLLLDFSTPFVVTINMVLGFSTRVATAIEFRGSVDFRRVGWLLFGNIPGLVLGLGVLHIASDSALRRGTGATIIVMALLMLFVKGTGESMNRRVVFGVGVAGGAFGATSSLNGIPPALLYTYEQSSPRRLIADLSAYFVVSNVLVFAVLVAAGFGSLSELLIMLPIWLPGVLAATYVANRLNGRIPVKAFRVLVLGVVLLGGASALISG